MSKTSQMVQSRKELAPKKRLMTTLLVFVILIGVQPSRLSAVGEDYALWHGNITVRNSHIDHTWWLKGHDAGTASGDWATAANKVSDLMSWDRTLADNYVTVFGNPYNNTLFVVLTRLDGSIIKPIQDRLDGENVAVRYIKGTASESKLKAWVKELDPKELKENGLPIVSCGISVNGTIILTLKEINGEYIDKLRVFIENRVPPGIIVVGIGDEGEKEVSEYVRPLTGGIYLQTKEYLGNNMWSVGFSTLGFILRNGTQKYALMAGHAVDPGQEVFQNNSFIPSHLIGTAINSDALARYSDSALVEVSDGTENQVRIDASTSIIINGMIGYEQQYVGQPVEKVGVTTGRTSGIISQKYDWYYLGQFEVLYNHIESTYWSEGGDSGGPVWTTINGVSYAIGLHTGRSSFNIYARYSPIDGVEKDFDLTFFDRVNMVVRGVYPDIYARMYLPPYWYNWVNIPGGTSDSPAIAVNGNRLYMVIRGGDGNTLYFGNVNRATEEFSGWTLLNGSTPSAPTLTSDGNRLVLVVRGGYNMVWYRIYTISTGTWGDWATLPTGSTSGSPAAAILGGKLHVVVTGYGSTALWHSSLDLSTFAFSGWQQVEGDAQSSPTLAASGSLNRLCLVVRGMSSDIFLKEWSQGSGWGSWIYLGGSTVYTVGVTVMEDTLHVACIGTDSVSLWHGRMILLSHTTLGWTFVDGQTPFRPTLAR